MSDAEKYESEADFEARKERNKDVSLSAFFRHLSIEDARTHLNTYTVEEVRQLWEAGVFGDSPVAKSIKTYITERIISGDRIE